MNTIAVIGGGASGLVAAITAARAGAKVFLIEKNERLGKKILSTGNGKCNLGNEFLDPSCYHSSVPDFFRPVLNGFHTESTISFFEEIGVLIRRKNHYLYPMSEQASSVADALTLEAEHLAVNILYETSCRKIVPIKGGFRLDLGEQSLTVNKVILACGSKASRISGSDGSGYSLAKSLGHSIVPVVPSLVQLVCAEKFYHIVNGVRVQGKVSAYSEERLIGEDTGEIQFTKNGISGIPVFQISGACAQKLYEKKEICAVLNFFPEMDMDQCIAFLKERAAKHPERLAGDFLLGVFPNKLNEALLKRAYIDPKMQVGQCTEKDIEILASRITHFQTKVTDTNGFEAAQVCRGGVDVREISPETLESKLHPGLYVTGELLDVDGICGGYNLQWAWASGFTAGREAAK